MSSEQREWRHFVEDMLHAIERIQQRIVGNSFEDFAGDADSLEIVAWNFLILGEAAGHIPIGVSDTHPGLPWADMRAMRNRIVHGYFSLDAKILWDTATDEIPALVPARCALVSDDGD